MRLIVTRPLAQAAPLVAELAVLGCDAVALPLIAIAPLADDAPLRAAWRRLRSGDPACPALAMFVSANAVLHFFAAAATGPCAPAWPATTLAGATGPGTAAALRRAGVPAAAIVEPGPEAERLDAEALWQALRQRRGDWRGAAAWIVRGEDGRDWLAEQLREAGATATFVAAYRRSAPAPSAAADAVVRAAQADPRGHRWLFSSSEAVRHLRQGWPAARWGEAAAWATHPRIEAAARQAGFGSVAAAPATLPALAAACRAAGGAQAGAA